MKFFLISPPSNCDDSLPWLEPLGLSYIAAVCKEAGHEVCIRDVLSIETADIPGLFSDLDAFEPDVVGFTAMTENFKNGLELARAVKSRYGCPVIFGGWHASGEPEVVLDPAIDYVVRAEGEDTILELLDYLTGKGPALSEINGLAYKEGNTFRVNPPRTRIRKLSRLPRPIREGLPNESYKFPMLFSQPLSRMRTLSVQASRGCPYTCVFCQTPSIWSNIWARRDPASVVDEMEDLFQKYGNNTLFIRDEEFTIRNSWVMEICEEMARRGLGEKITWGNFSRVDDVTPELVAAMKKAGCSYVFMGVEATSDEEGKKLNKFFKREEAERAFSLFRKAGITTHGSWIIGFPWDTLDSLKDAFSWIRTLPMDFLSVLYATPFGGTPLRKYVEENGLLLTKDPNFFNDYEPAIATPEIPLEILRTLASYFRNRFYFDSRYMARIAVKCLLSWRYTRIVAELLYGSIYRYIRRRRLSGRREQVFTIPPRFFEPCKVSVKQAEGSDQLTGLRVSGHLPEDSLLPATVP